MNQTPTQKSERAEKRNRRALSFGERKLSDLLRQSTGTDQSRETKQKQAGRAWFGGGDGGGDLHIVEKNIARARVANAEVKPRGRAVTPGAPRWARQPTKEKGTRASTWIHHDRRPDYP